MSTLAISSPETTSLVMRNDNPYVGPRSFKTGEKLYGRDSEALDLLDLLIAERIVLLYSPSGAGKSSLIQAELMPRLIEEGFHILPTIRVSTEPPATSSQFSVLSAQSPETTENSELKTQNSKFNRYIFSALLSLEEGLRPDQQLPLAELASLDLDAYLRQRPRPTDAPDSDVLIFDQFEEILTIDPINQAAKSAFFAQVGAALRDRSRWTLFSMREDYVAGLDPFLRPLPTRLSTTFRLDLLGEATARQAMQQPARAAGVDFTDAAARKLADDLRRVRIQQPDGQAEEQIGLYVEPVQLQVVCHRLWNRLSANATQITEEDIAAVGNVDKALAGYYAERVSLIAILTGVSERAIRDWFDTQLITEQGIRGQVLQSTGKSAGLENPVIRELINSHLVRAEKRRGATWFELAHDRLIDPVRANNAAWREANLSLLQRQAALWEGQDRPDGLLLRGAALEEAERWATAHQEELTPVEQAFLDDCREMRAKVLRERRTNRRIRRLAILAAVGCVISIVALIYVIQARADADHKRQLAIARELVAHAGSQLAIKPQRSLLLALEALSIYRELDERPDPDAEDSLRRGLSSTGGLVLHAHGQPIGAVAFSPNSRWLMTGSEDGDVRLWDLGAGDPSSTPRPLSGHSGAIKAVAFSPDGHWLASADAKGALRLWDLGAGDPSSTPRLLSGHSGAINAVAFSPDGHWLASADAKGALRLWDLSAGDPSAAVEVLSDSPGSIGAVGFSSDGHWLAAAQNRAAQLWDMADLSAEPYTLSGHTDQVTVLAFSPDDHWLATGSADATAHLWDLTDQNPAATSIVLQGHEEPISAITFSPDSHRLITGSSDTTAHVWDIPISGTGTAPIVLRGHNDQIFGLAISADSRWLVTASRDSTARVWDLDSADPSVAATILRGHEGEIRSVAISPDNRWIATGSGDSTARLWRLTGPDSAAAPWVLRGHTSVVRALAFSRDGRWLATGSGDSTARLWNLQDPSAEPIVLHGHANALRALAISNDNHWLVTTSSDTINMNVRLWDLSANDPSRTLIFLRGHSSGVRAAAFSPDSRWLATADQEGGIRLWSIGAGPPSTTGIALPGPSRQLRVVAFSEDSRWLATGGDDSIVRLWDVSGQNPATTPIELRGHSGAIRALAFSYDNRWLVSGGDDGTPILWGLKAQDPAAAPIRLPRHGPVVRAAAFSRDGRWMVTGSSDSTARLWNMSGTPLAALDEQRGHIDLVGHIDEIRALAISEDSHWLLTGSEDGDARLWDLTLADPRGGSNVTSGPVGLVWTAGSVIMPGHTGPVWAVAISPDGRWMATGSQDGTARLWTHTTLGAAGKLACRIAGRNLSNMEWDQYVRAPDYYRTCSEFPSGQNTPADAPPAP